MVRKSSKCTHGKRGKPDKSHPKGRCPSAVEAARAKRRVTVKARKATFGKMPKYVTPTPRTPTPRPLNRHIRF